jgi:hypothetical protein
MFECHRKSEYNKYKSHNANVMLEIIYCLEVYGICATVWMVALLHPQLFVLCSVAGIPVSTLATSLNIKTNINKICQYNKHLKLREDPA